MIKIRAIATVVISTAMLMLVACSSPPPPPPPAPPPPPPIPGPQSISERTLLTMATDFAFGSGSYRLKHAGKLKLDALVPEINSQPPTTKVTVYGYTDDRPISAELRKQGVVDNLDLSSKRADAVVRYLVSKGVNPSIISAKGRGDTHPAAPNDTKAGRGQNRRIEVVVEQPAG